MLLDNFIFSNFNYCPLAWHVYSASLSRKKEKIQKHALRLLYYSSCNSLLIKAEWSTMEVSCLRRLAVEVFKTLKCLNLDFMQKYLKSSSHSARRKNDLIVNREKTKTFDEKLY